MSNQQSEAGVFINGKAQIIEMLKFMSSDERETLIHNIRIKNPTLANELMSQSLTFDHIGKLNEHELTIMFQYVSAPILGVALKNAAPDIQRKILSLANRTYAEEAYKIMITPIGNEKRDISRAQNKILSILVSLSKRKQIDLH